jgi:hypothetical protein
MKPASSLAAVLFIIFALVHVIRLVLGWHVTIGTNDIPMWVSWAAIVVSLTLAFALVREARSHKH